MKPLVESGELFYETDPEYPRVTVFWEDPAFGPNAWEDPKKFTNSPENILETRGFLIMETKDRIVLAMTVDHLARGGDVSPKFTIPIGCVLKIIYEVRDADQTQKPKKNNRLSG